MRYSYVLTGNSQENLVIHVDKRLLNNSILGVSLNYSREQVKKEVGDSAVDPEGILEFFNLVTEIDGMTPIMVVERYEITLNKGLLFSWEDLLPLITYALEVLIAKEPLEYAEVELFINPVPEEGQGVADVQTSS